MSIVGIIVSVISASYYLKVIRVLHSSTEQSGNESQKYTFAPAEDKSKNINFYNTESLISNFHSFLISSLTLFILFFILKPSLILNSTQLLSLSLFYY